MRVWVALLVLAGCSSVSPDVQPMTSSSSLRLSSTSSFSVVSSVPAPSSVAISPVTSQSSLSSVSSTMQVSSVAPDWVQPVAHSVERITKKPFGIYITRQHSPVQPERFSGYHTAIDFELLDGESAHDVRVYAVCSGPVIYSKYVNGYGGVVIQRCVYQGQTVTVLYGHVQLASVQFAIGEEVQKGVQLAVLGEGHSAETDGERAHLHLGIHKGSAVELKGYVQRESDLDSWLDPAEVLGL